MAGQDDLSILEVELKRLRNSLAHLEASQQELKQAMQADVDAGNRADPDLKEAFQDNIVTIAKFRARWVPDVWGAHGPWACAHGAVAGHAGHAMAASSLRCLLAAPACNQLLLVA